MSVSHEGLFLLKKALVNSNLSFDDVCKEKLTSIAYNNEPPLFVVTEGELETNGFRGGVGFVSLTLEWEIQIAFFKYNNIKPQWINCNFDWGRLNYTTGQWSGAVGMIQRDEADYALMGFGGSYDRSKVAAFSPATNHMPSYILTRYPLKVPPTWNLFYLFTKGLKLQMRSFVKLRSRSIPGPFLVHSNSVLFKYKRPGPGP